MLEWAPYQAFITETISVSFIFFSFLSQLMNITNYTKL